MGAVVHVGAIALFLVLARFRPRIVGLPLLNAHTLVNLFTGGALFLMQWGVLQLGVSLSEYHLVDLGFLKHAGLQFLFAFLVSDFFRYWLHRMHHRIPFLWYFHRVHHSSKYLDATSGLRMHLVDFIQLKCIPFLLFSVIFDVRHFDGSVWFAIAAVVGVMDAFQHSNLAMDLRSPLLRAWDRLFNNPHFHSWHHTNQIEVYGDGNYGQALTIWDRLFGSCVSQEMACTELGLDDAQDLNMTVVGMQLLTPAPVSPSPQNEQKSP